MLTRRGDVDDYPLPQGSWEGPTYVTCLHTADFDRSEDFVVAWRHRSPSR